MIGKPEIIRTAGHLNLNPHVVEKDYALGWLLAGISSNKEIADNWVFKGGTCLKKCFFETYRFSEDLDFTLQDESHLDEAFLKGVFAEIGEWVYEQCGLELPADKQDFDIYENPRGKLSCQGKISYRGPVSPTSGGWPRIKLDLTADECLVLPPKRIPVFHPYTDAPHERIIVQTYSYEEAFGEKIRALAERTRPRDLYDVINLYRNIEALPSPSVLLEVLTQKCDFKGISVPKCADLEPFRNELGAAWENMLRHQLPALPPVDSFWDALPEFFSWLETGLAPEIMASFKSAPGEKILREHTLNLPLNSSLKSYLEIIRFAASNRLCIDLEYQQSTRRIEPYSLRLTKDGNIILHAWNINSDGHRSYRVDRINDAHITNQIFTPRYAVELTPADPIRIPQTERSSSPSNAPRYSSSRSGISSKRRSSARQSASTFAYGPTYIYECLSCNKKFRRKKQSTTLNSHKTKDGWPCSGRIGYLVDTKY